MALWIVAKRGVFLIVFFGALLIYSFDVIYKNAYIKLEYIDYSNSAVIFDGRKESAVITKITDSLREKDAIINKALDKEYKDIFVYEVIQKAENSVPLETEYSTERPVSENADGSAAGVGAAEGGNAGSPIDPGIIVDETVK